MPARMGRLFNGMGRLFNGMGRLFNGMGRLFNGMGRHQITIYLESVINCCVEHGGVYIVISDRCTELCS